jgi:hypothetical protein
MLMVMMISSVSAECVLEGKCESQEDCKKLEKDGKVTIFDQEGKTCKINKGGYTEKDSQCFAVLDKPRNAQNKTTTLKEKEKEAAATQGK